MNANFGLTLAEVGSLNEISEESTTPAHEGAITLKLLNAVEGNSALTQRGAAQDLGIALGLVNAYLKRCIRKGLIKVAQAPANRYVYYLTPNGFAEKSRLTAEYLQISFKFFRAARRQCSDVFEICDRKGWLRVVLVGAGDLTEIATLCAVDHQIEILAVIDFDGETETFAGIPVVTRLDEAQGHDALVITSLDAPQALFDRLVRDVAAERVLAPQLLNISRTSQFRAAK